MLRFSTRPSVISERSSTRDSSRMLWLCWSVFSCLSSRIWVSETIDNPTRLKTPVMIATQISIGSCLDDLVLADLFVDDDRDAGQRLADVGAAIAGALRGQRLEVPPL